MKPGLALLLTLQLAAHSQSAATPQARAAEQQADGSTGSAPAAAPPRRVLALYSEPSDHPYNVTFDRQFYGWLRQQSGGTIEHYAEYFESYRFPGSPQALIMRDYLRQKYAARKIDVLFAWGPFTLEFLLTYRQELFPETPIVYYVTTLESIRHLPAPPLTGVMNPDAYEKTLELALDLHPDTTHAFIISSTPDHDKQFEREASLQLERFSRRVRLTYLTDLPLDQLIATVEDLPRHSVIIYSRQSEEPGRALRQADYVGLVSRAASVPVYGPWRSLLGHGSTGGLVDDPIAGAAKAAEIVVRIARGARPQDVPAVLLPKVPTFDARQLTRWGISEARLPPGSVVLFREPTLWSQYRYYIVGIGLMLGVQTLLIAGLLVQRARRRRVEEALQESQKRYALATAAGSVGVWDWNLETNAIYVTPELKRALGYADHEIENRFDSWCAHVHPEDADRLLLDARVHIGDGTATFEHERRMVHRDGSVRWFLTRGSAVRQPDGRVARITGTDTDITERKAAEASLEEARREFTRLARVTTLAQFAASIAHEVSQPMSAILMNSKACLAWLAGSGASTTELRPALLDIVAAAHRAQEVMTRDRELFRHHVADVQALDINGVISDVAALARTRLAQSHVGLTLTLDDTLPLVAGDRVELQQVVLNLLVNGIEAMDAVDPRSRSLTIETRLAGEQLVQVTVRDTGTGMRDVDVDRLFTPFYTTKRDGTGVGLSISRSIIEAHGGQLWAEPDNTGAGAVFCFTLPVATGQVTGEDAGAGATGDSEAPHGRTTVPLGAPATSNDSP